MPQRNRLLEHINGHGEISPDLLACPITKCTMYDPVLAADGVTYERRALDMWLTMNGGRSPMTQQIMPRTVETDHTLRNLIAQVCGGTLEEYHVPPEVRAAQLCAPFDRLVSRIEGLLGNHDRLMTLLCDIQVGGPRLLGLPHNYDPFIPLPTLRECKVRQNTVSQHLGWVVELALGGMRSSWPALHGIIHYRLAHISAMVRESVFVALSAAGKPLSTSVVKSFQALLRQRSAMLWSDWWLVTKSAAEASACAEAAMVVMGRLEMLYMDATEADGSARTLRWLNRCLCRVLSQRM